MFKGKEATDQATVSLKNFNETIKDGNSLMKNAITEVQTVETAFRQYKKGIITADEALVVFNENLGDNLGVHQDIETAMQAFNDLHLNILNEFKWLLLKSKRNSSRFSLEKNSAEMKKTKNTKISFEKH